MVGSSVGSITGTVSLVLGFDVKDTVVVVFGSCVVLCCVVRCSTHKICFY